jgi:DNA-3-methyladenine glycosylase
MGPFLLTSMNTSSGLKKLGRNFYLRPTAVVARDLLGCYLCRRVGGQILMGRIVEVEAYPGRGDPASHSFRGETRRNRTMFRNGGHLYVYFTYGMHFCANVVTGGEGTGAAVLLRAIEPVKGMRAMERNRFGKRKIGSHQGLVQKLCNGPANLCTALGITGLEDGTDLCGNEIWISRSGRLREPVAVTRRVGISKGVSHRWRFFLPGSPFISPGKPV